MIHKKIFRNAKSFLDRTDFLIYSAYGNWKIKMEKILRNLERAQKKRGEIRSIKKISHIKSGPKVRTLKRLSGHISREIKVPVNTHFLMDIRKN